MKENIRDAFLERVWKTALKRVYPNLQETRVFQHNRGYRKTTLLCKFIFEGDILYTKTTLDSDEEKVIIKELSEELTNCEAGRAEVIKSDDPKSFHFIRKQFKRQYHFQIGSERHASTPLIINIIEDISNHSKSALEVFKKIQSMDLEKRYEEEKREERLKNSTK